jgi:regulator of sirC expression with transglutaminase-like and TPR domain
MSRLRDDFAALVAAGPRTDLARGALAIARIGHPALDPDRHLRQLDALAAAARPALTPGAPPGEAARTLARHLFAACGFRGNVQDYYDPRNSFLNYVLERRTGIPITLAVVLIETARRLGLGLEGVGFPGHFLVRVPDPAAPLLLDPFHGGRGVSDAELLARYRALGHADADRVPPEAVASTGALGILTRMLRNLERIYVDHDDCAHALEAVELLLVLVPDSPDDIRVRGLLHERLECFGAASEDLRRYLALVPDAPDADRVRARLAELARRGPTIH